ncbi:hypothetical protein FE782_01740 [Paenibacillus antri]|uniref:Uncharacterized protein n=1 Tax=Paenibacillus antri TaxID=2582848 RepID=A0A5R9GE87_9BACL|nr:deaminase domain-containing protein [Paenibacillus antri]TLS54091.1 hypothetical protein FE782_01740 [Paenibacillus antri]
MRATLHVKHYKQSLEGYLLYRKYLDWIVMLEAMAKAGDLTGPKLHEHIRGNYAVGLLEDKTLGRRKFYYSTTMVKTEGKYNAFINRVKGSKAYASWWEGMLADLYYKTPEFYQYIEVDRSRGVRTPGAKRRVHDSECIILENISEFIHHQRLHDYKVYIYSHKEPCLNCDLVFQQFLERHSQSELTIFYHHTYHQPLPSKYSWRY